MEFMPPPGTSVNGEVPSFSRFPSVALPSISFETAVMSVTGLALLIFLVRHAATYFFVFDDFALIHVASTSTLAQIFTQPHFAFFRPFAFLLTKAHFALSGWNGPAAYIGFSLVVHAINALLVAVLARQLSERATWRQAALAALFFVLSPWAAESFLWMSGRFDLLATFGVLVSLVCGLVVCRTQNGGIALLAALAGCLGQSLGVFSKELAVVTPALLAAAYWCVIATTSRPFKYLPAMLYVVALCLIVAVYLFIRESLLPNLGGAYGTLASLVGGATIATNLGKFVARLVAHPSGPMAAVVFALCAIYALARQRRTALGLAWFAVIAFLISLAPVIWAGLPETGFGGGRFIYAPGIYFALILGLGLGYAQEAQRPTLLASRIVLVVVLTLLLWNLNYQTRVWRDATAIARTSIEQLAPYVATTQTIFIPNLPFWYTEGAYALKAYAFGYYYGVDRMPAIVARPFSLKFEKGSSQFVAWADEYGAAQPPAGSLVVPLTLPGLSVPLAPLAPRTVRVDIVGRDVTVSWTAAQAGGIADTYVVEAGTEPQFTTPLVKYVVPSPRTSLFVPGAAPGRYFVRVRAENGVGASLPSPETLVVIRPSSR